VLGLIGSKYYGTPLIMDILEENGLRGTFFTEMLARDVVDGSELEAAYRSIRDRGHDAQLHLHPVFHFYGCVTQGLLKQADLPQHMDWIGSLSTETQTELLKKAKESFLEIFGFVPTAFRAGCYGASTSTLAALDRIGIRYDSSYNAAYTGTSCLLPRRSQGNIPWRNGLIWEIPVTTFETGTSGLRGLKPLEVSAVSFAEMRGVLSQAEQIGQESVVVILHSFAFLKRTDPQFQTMRPNQIVIRRFEELCRFLRLNRDRFRALTFSQIPEPAENTAAIPSLKMGSLIPAVRKCVQAVNRIYWV